MTKIPMRFKRITAALDEVARARLCQSSRSEHSAAAENNSVTDLSDLVDSFLETVNVEHDEYQKMKKKKEQEEERDCLESDCCSCTKEMLISLISQQLPDDEDTFAKQIICEQMEKACRKLGNGPSEGFKRRAMCYLRKRSFDAGLCKSRWEKTGSHPAGEYEYIDVLISKTRYIVEASLAAEFTIARPTKPYISLLETFPQVVVCKESKVKEMARLMCNAMRESMKKRGLDVPPWRINGYMQSKWFGSYRRTTNTVSKSPSTAKDSYGVGDLAGKRLVGFEALPMVGHAVGDLWR